MLKNNKTLKAEWKRLLEMLTSFDDAGHLLDILREHTWKNPPTDPDVLALIEKYRDLYLIKKFKEDEEEHYAKKPPGCLGYMDRSHEEPS